LSLVVKRLKNRKSKGEEGFLSMPPIEGAIDSNQKQTFEQGISISGLRMQSWELAFHRWTS
jgi:hypothetical protein